MCILKYFLKNITNYYKGQIINFFLFFFFQAVEHIKNIEQRLKGLVRSQGKKLENIALNLSVEGQTNHLILEAMNIDNLCQMYFGWGAYM